MKEKNHPAKHQKTNDRWWRWTWLLRFRRQGDRTFAFGPDATAATSRPAICDGTVQQLSEQFVFNRDRGERDLLLAPVPSDTQKTPAIGQ